MPYPGWRAAFVRYSQGSRNARRSNRTKARKHDALLLNDDGTLTSRGQTIIDHTPAGRFGRPEELLSTLLWLCGPGANFVSGVVVPVDGGFSAFSGV
ncbi:MAG: hypothetical protein OHK0015_11130 [Chloroflexi bacterium OHK40]